MMTVVYHCWNRWEGACRTADLVLGSASGFVCERQRSRHRGEKATSAVCVDWSEKILTWVWKLRFFQPQIVRLAATDELFPLSVLMTITPKTKDAVSCQAPREPMSEHHTQNVSPYWLFSILLVPRLLAAQFSIIGDCDEGNVSPNRDHNKLTCSLQLLGTHPLSRPRQWFPDLGILSSLCHTQLGVYRNSCICNKVVRSFATLKGAQPSLLAVTALGSAILRASCCICRSVS